MKKRGKIKKRLWKALKRLQQRLDGLDKPAPAPKAAVPALPSGGPIADLVFILDQTQRHLMIFGPWLGRFDVAPELFLGKTARDFLGVDDAFIHEQANQRVLSGQQVVYDYAWAVRPLAEPHSFHTSLVPLRDAEGTIVGIAGVARDVTEGVRLGEQRAYRIKQAALGRMAGGVVHHYNNLLTVIMGYSEMLLGQMRPEDPMRQYVLQIQEAASRAAAGLRPLLAFTGKQTLVPQAIDLNVFLVQRKEALVALLGTTVQLILVPGLEAAPIQIDTDALEQVIGNLARNARAAMPQGGTFKIAVANVDDEEARAQLPLDALAVRYVVMTVSDTGSGMSAETQKHLFEPFFTTRDVGQGMGLGLAAVHGIVKQSGGHIAVDSRVGQGTTFRIYLPQS
jgi:signal transduction histidine kinase